MKKWLPIVFVVGLMAFFLACRPHLSAQDSPASRPVIPLGQTISNPQVVTPTPTPTPTMPPPWAMPTRQPPADMHGATPLPPDLWKEQIKKAEAMPGGITRAGPETKGSTITIADKKIKLPADAYWNGILASLDCAAGIPCPDPPIITIRRGNSFIQVQINTGQITSETIASGEAGIFAFLDKELPTQVTGPRTKGATLNIAGKSVKLPDDAFVMRIMTEKDIRPGADCVRPGPLPQPWNRTCPKPPVYGIVGPGGAIFIDGDGKVSDETVMWLETFKRTFDPVKEQLR